MSYLRNYPLVILSLVSTLSLAQQPDTTRATMPASAVVDAPVGKPPKAPADSLRNIATFSGSLGITNNGFSIIPTFSLNSPATNIMLYYRKGRFSFDPDIRLVPDLSKGGLLFWFRYRLIEQKRFSLRVGVHPAFSLVHKTITTNGTDSRITEMLRFAAWEAVPSYQITPKWGISAVYLQGNGLQRNGPQRTHVLFLNNAFSNLNIGGDFRLTLVPTLFWLYLDGDTGSYFTATAILSKKNVPFTLQSTINQTLRANIPGNQNFMWNVLLAYNFSKTYRRVQ
jgi:hypothetical protein